MAKNVFDQIAEKLSELPEEINQAYLKAAKKAINEAGDNLERNLQRNSQSAQYIPDVKGLANIDKDKWEEAKQKLTDNLYVKKYETPFSYTYEVDWTDKIVNEDLGVALGKFSYIPRRAGARNYSKAPATYHDLAYILSEGRGINFSKTGAKFIQGTKFIEKAWRSAKKWRNKRDIYFAVEMDILGNKFNEGDTE